MARRLILDTGVLIEQERGRVIRGIERDDDVAMSAVTLGELWTGVHLARDDQRMERRREFVEGLCELIPVLSYDDDVAAAHGALLAHVHRTGTPRGAHDLIIAATAVSTGRTLVATDRAAGFDSLPDLSVLEL